MSGRRQKKKNAKQRKITRLKDLCTLCMGIQEWLKMYMKDLDSDEKMVRFGANCGKMVRLERYKIGNE